MAESMVKEEIELQWTHLQLSWEMTNNTIFAARYKSEKILHFTNA